MKDNKRLKWCSSNKSACANSPWSNLLCSFIPTHTERNELMLSF
uniref:Uncharacterized protein n=1 Tax=Arundo donax TaxID=35708 RepID=A0A0A8ZVE0_ARUDO